MRAARAGSKFTMTVRRSSSRAQPGRSPARRSANTNYQIAAHARVGLDEVVEGWRATGQHANRRNRSTPRRARISAHRGDRSMMPPRAHGRRQRPAAGGSLSDTEKGQSIYSDRGRSRPTAFGASFDRLWVLAAENATSALIDLKGLIQASPAGATFTQYRGYTCTGGGGYVNMLFVPSTHAVNYTLNEAHFAIWNLTDGQDTAAAAAFNTSRSS